jgi:plastocyanin
VKNFFARTRKSLSLRLLAGVWLTAVLLSSCFASGKNQTSDPVPPATDKVNVTVTLENVDSNAWTVTAVEGADGITETGVEDPVISLEVGKRYRFVNNGSLTIHPLAIRSEDGEPVLGQRPNDRPFELDPSVAFEADEEGISFTLTEALAAVVSTYYCTAHPTPLMEGKLEVRSVP